jgi:DNA-directed RNA polymerase sigma subunit (sigma70/sigma32)
MVVFTAILVDMDRSLAFSPVADGCSGGAERRRTNSRIGFTSEDSIRGTTDLNVAMSPPMNLQFSSSAAPKNDNQQAPKKRSRSSSTNELVSLPSSSRAVSLGKRNRNSKMIRPKSLNSRARILAVTEGSDLLTQEEEQHLTLHIRRLRQGARIRDELVTQTERQPTETEWAETCGLSVMELRRIMYEGQEARSVLVSANAGLVTSIAKRHYHAVKQSTEFGGGLGTILTMQDMIQEGNLGLMQAAERFEPERGLRFSTYATYWVRQRIFRSISDSSRTIRLPVHGEYLYHHLIVSLLH